MSEENETPKINSWFIYGIILFLALVLILSSFPSLGFTIDAPQLAIIAIIVILLLFRYFDVIEVIGVLKLKKEVQEIKNETKEIRQAQMSLMQTLTVTQNAMASSHIYINPLVNSTVKDAEEEAETLIGEIPAVANRDLAVSDKIKKLTDKISIRISRQEYGEAFLVIRQRIESLLVAILGLDARSRYNFSKVIRDAKSHPMFTPSLIESLKTVYRFASYAIHFPPSSERRLPPDEVDQIVELGLRVIAELESIKRQRQNQP